MAKLKRDERVCPLCAETIKAAASRCRFCHADVEPIAKPEQTETPAPESATQPALTPKPEPEVEAVADPPRPEVSRVQAVSDFLRRRLTLVLAVLVVLAACGVGASWWRAEQGFAAAAPNGSLVGEAARTEVLVSAADLTQRTLSYDYKTLANDMEVARARMTPSFRKEYDGTMSQVKDNTTKNKIVLQAVAVSSAIINATDRKAKVLVFTNQTTTAGGKNQQLNRNTLVVSLTKIKGNWVISKLAALG